MFSPAILRASTRLSLRPSASFLPSLPRSFSTDSPEYLQWQKMARKESKCPPETEDIREYLTHYTPEGLPLRPVYSNPEGTEYPGVKPFTRGPYATMYSMRPWTIR